REAPSGGIVRPRTSRAQYGNTGGRANSPRRSASRDAARARCGGGSGCSGSRGFVREDMEAALTARTAVLVEDRLDPDAEVPDREAVARLAADGPASPLHRSAV